MKNFKLGSVQFPQENAFAHVLIMGEIGCGKTQLLKPNIEKALSDDTCKNVIYSANPDLLDEFFDASRDLIFHPTDARSIKWTVFNDVRDYFDLKSLASYIVPKSHDPLSGYFDTAARQIIESILMKLWETGETTNAAIRRAVNMSVEELGEFISGYPGEKHLGNKDVISTLGNKIQFIDFLPDGDFSIRNWVQNGEASIFMVNTDSNSNLKPIFSCFVGMLANEMLSLSDNQHPNPIYFFLEDFATLGRLDNILDLLTKARSKGIGIFMTLQDPAQGEKIYGKKDWDTIVANCKNKAISKRGSFTSRSMELMGLR